MQNGLSLFKAARFFIAYYFNYLIASNFINP